MIFFIDNCRQNGTGRLAIFPKGQNLNRPGDLTNPILVTIEDIGWNPKYAFQRDGD